MAGKKRTDIKPFLEWTNQEKRFVRAYARHGNATRAAREAGYNCDNPLTACSVGYELTTKPHIKAHLDEMRRIVQSRAEFSPERILTEVALIAFSNPGNLLKMREVWKDPEAEERGEPPDSVRATLDFEGATEADLRAISSIKETEDGMQVTMLSKVSALEMLGKHHRLFVDRVELGIDDDLIERLRRGRERAAKVAALQIDHEEDQDDERTIRERGDPGRGEGDDD